MKKSLVALFAIASMFVMPCSVEAGNITLETAIELAAQDNLESVTKYTHEEVNIYAQPDQSSEVLGTSMMNTSFDVAFEIDEDQVAAGFVANDFGICIAPDIPILHSLDLKILPLVSPSWQRNFYMAMLKDVYHPPVVESFKKFVIETTSKEIFYKTN